MRLLNTALLLLLAAPALADEAPDLHTWGKLSPVKKTEFFQLKYKDRSGLKPKSAKAYLSLADDVQVLADQRIPLSALTKGTQVWIYGKPVERSVMVDGATQIDRQIVNTLIVAAGDGLNVKPTKEKGPAEQEWLQATVTRSEQGFHVDYNGSDYKVVSLKSMSSFRRIALEKTPKLKKQLVEVVAMSSDERPEKAKEEEKSFSVDRLVILDKRLAKTAYPLLLQ